MLAVRSFLAAILLCQFAVLPDVASGKEMVTLNEIKGWKKLLRSRTNVLALFAGDERSVADLLPTLENVASEIKGKGTVAFVDCSNSKKLCKSIKVSPDKYLLKHYKDGSYHKEYDRLIRKSSFLEFLRDPTSEPPWSEDLASKDVWHVESSSSLYKLLGKERKPILVMFYAPWCSHCQRMKPEFARAATALKGKAVLAGMDVDKPEAMLIREEFNITGFPTVLYFEEGKLKYDYWKERDAKSIVEWMRDPQPPPEREKVEHVESNWSNELPDVVHLGLADFEDFIASSPSVLVTFYAPWCGHCKAMKPHYNEAGRVLEAEKIPGKLAAVDATAEVELAKRFDVEGFPTIKYFQNGELMYDYGFPRTTEAFVEFMRNPQEPPPPEKDWTELETEIHHLTDENFKSFTKKTKHSLVMFYAPWCGHCKAMKPDFMSAAEELKKNKKKAFAAVDCTKFTLLCNSHDVQGYPTIKYFNYGKNPIKYLGPRSREGFLDFIRNPDSIVSKDEL